jgi:predicted RNase H-like nuclease
VADTERREITFSGFDSAWGTKNSGAICDLLLNADGSLRLAGDPVIASWDHAIAQASQVTAAEMRVWAVDQPLCVRNAAESRPVERDLQRALMAGFGCGAYSSNLGNPCWQPGARIWDFVQALDENGYLQNPMAIPAATSGRYYFECYPHPALLGLFDLDHIIKYKVHHRNKDEWRRIIDLLRSLTDRDLPVVNIRSFVREDLVQNKANEDKLDAIVSAYTAAYWWRFGAKRSTMIGDLTTGYIVTPHSHRTYAALAKVFDGRMNIKESADGLRATETVLEKTPTARSLPSISAGNNGSPVEPPDGWSPTVELTATDTSNIWRTSRGAVINSWMDAQRMTGWRLWVRFLEEDGQPAVLFVPFGSQGSQQCGMKTSSLNRSLWSFMVADAVRTNPLHFPVCYRYEEIR